MNRTALILTVIAILLLIPACASVPRQNIANPAPEADPVHVDGDAAYLLAIGWQFLGAENFAEALRTIEPLTAGTHRAGSVSLDPTVSEAWRIEAYVHLVRGELRLEADAWRQSLLHDPQGAHALTAWLRFSDIQSYLGEFGPVRDFGLALLGTGLLDPPTGAEVTFVTAKALANLGEHGPAQEMMGELAFADAWSVIGPFDGVAGSGFERPFGPEQDFATDHAHEDDWGSRHQWRRLEGLPLAWIDLAELYGETHDRVFYAVTSATVTGATPAVLGLGLSGGVKVWLNGELTLENEMPRYLPHDIYETRVNLASGKNTILVKVCGSGNFPAGLSLRLMDMEGNPMPVRWDSQARRGSVVALADGDAAPRAWPAYIRARDHYLQVGDLDAAISLAYLADYGDVEREFLNEFPAIDDRFGYPTPLLNYLADCHGAIGNYDAAGSLYKLMDQINPSAIGGRLHRYSQLISDGDGETAYADMCAGWQENPNAIVYAPLVVQAALELGKTRDLDALLTEWERVSPDDPRLALVMAGENGIINDPSSKVAYLLSKWQDQQENRALVGAVSAAYLEALDPDGATSFLAAWTEDHPHSPFTVYALACFAGMAGDMEACGTWAKRAIELAPDEPEFKQLLGNVHRDLGEFDEASSLFAEALHDQPDNWELREALWTMSPDHEEPAGFLTETTDELIAADRQEPAFRDASSYLLLDDMQRLVLRDLASKVTRRFVGRVNDEHGVKESTQKVLPLPSQCFHFEVDKLVTIKPDGRRVQGEVSENGVSFTDLEPGDYFEVAYTCYVSSSTFMGREVWQAHLMVGNYPRRLARFQLLRPHDLDLAYLHPSAARAEVETVGDEMVRMVWFLENTPALQFAAGMTTAALAPYLLDFSSVDAWSAVGSWYERQTYRQCKPNDQLTDFAVQLVAGATSDKEKALILARFVTARIAYSEPQFQVAMVTPGNADATLQRGIGDCKDQCALLLALARAVGIDGSLALMHTELGRDYPLLPGIRFNHVVACLELDGETIWVDPTTGYHDPSTLALHLQGAEVLLLDGSESRMLRLPVEDARRSQIAIHTMLDLDDTGRADQRTQVTGKGGQAQWILAAGAELSRHERHQFIESSYSSVTGDMDVVSVTMPDTDVLSPEAEFAFAADRRMHLMPLGANLGLQAPFQTCIEDLAMPSLRNRHTDLDLAAARGVMTEEVVVELPATLTVVSIPDDVVLETPEATYRFAVRVEGNTLVFERELTVTALEVPVEHCEAFAEFLNQASRAERSMVVLSDEAGAAIGDGIASTEQ